MKNFYIASPISKGPRFKHSKV